MQGHGWPWGRSPRGQGHNADTDTRRHFKRYRPKPPQADGWQGCWRRPQTGSSGPRRAASSPLSIYITRNAQNRGAQAGGGVGIG